MADTSIDELLEAVESIRDLKNALLRHDDLFTQLGDRLALIEGRLAILEATPHRTARKPA